MARMFAQWILALGLAGLAQSALLRHHADSPMLGHLSVNMTSLVASAGPSCECTFDGACSCAAARSFLACVKNACGSGQCQCGEWRQQHACDQMAAACPGVGLQCGASSATCGSVQELPTAPIAPIAADEAKDHDAEKSTGEKSESANVVLGHTFAFSFMGTVMMMAVVFGMASNKDDQVRNYTWFVLDQVTAVFLAVMYFQAFNSFLHALDSGLLDHIYGVSAARDATHFSTIVACMHALVTLAMALVLAYKLRKHDVGLAIVCGCGAHITAFTSIHAAASAQNHIWLGMVFSPLMCVVSISVLGGVLALLAVGIYKMKQRAGVTEDDAFMDKTDDMENDFGSMGFSVCWTMMVRYVITGEHPEDDELDNNSTATERMHMLYYGCACIVFGVLFIGWAMGVKSQTKSYPVSRLMTFLSAVASLNIAWAFLYWAEWELFGHQFKGMPIFGRVCFAMIMTIIGCIAVFGLAKMHTASHDGKRKVFLMVFILLIAFSWELCFDEAVEAMVEGSAHPAMLKIAAALAMMAVIVPVYAFSMKPISGPAGEAIGA